LAGTLLLALAAGVWATKSVSESNGKIELAYVRIKILDAKRAFLEDRAFDALLLALSAGHKLKALDPAIGTNNENNIKTLAIANLSRFVYNVKEKTDLFILLVSTVSPLVLMASPSLPLVMTILSSCGI